MIFELVGAWLLGIFTQSLLNDSKAVILCRNDLLELEKLLEGYGRKILDHTRSESYDIKKVESIKSVLKNLELNHAGLVFKNHELEDLINQSGSLIFQFECNPDEPQNQPHAIGINLLTLWGVEALYNSHKVTKVVCLRKFFYGGFFRRAYLYCCACTNKYWQKVQGFFV